MTTEPDPHKVDPFFMQIADGQWNACIGRQGNKENYLDGYIEAAIELADVVIEKQLFGQRDTLVLPILYNARHAVELLLKYAIDALTGAGIIEDSCLQHSHNIRALWDYLCQGGVADEKLKVSVAALKPFIHSLATIDDDGQALRYHRSVKGEVSLDQYCVANLRLIRASLQELKEYLSVIKYRVNDFVDEYRSGSITETCSRTDLFTIAMLLPPRDQWRTEAFDEQKASIKERFGLSNRKFSDVLDKIQELRETKATIGVETDLIHLTDASIVAAVEHWRKLHPKREFEASDPGAGIVNGSEITVEELLEHGETLGSCVTAWRELLSVEQLAELQVLFYLGRDQFYAEYYESRVSRTIKEYESAEDMKDATVFLLNKTNLLAMVRKAARRIGRLRLAETLDAM